MTNPSQTPSNTTCPKHWAKKEWWATCDTCPNSVTAEDFYATTTPTPQKQGEDYSYKAYQEFKRLRDSTTPTLEERVASLENRMDTLENHVWEIDD